MIELITGPMFSGKSNYLIEKYFEHKRRFIPTAAIIPAMDTRSAGSISSRATKFKIDAKKVSSEDDIKGILNDLPRGSDVFVDEVQFLPSSVTAVIVLNASDYNFYVAGLLTDFRQEMFPSTSRILNFADRVRFLTARCAHCGELCATETIRLVENDEQIVVGSDIYAAVCPNCNKKG